MKITGARVIVCCPGRNFITLKIETDVGLTGLGDAAQQRLESREGRIVGADHHVQAPGLGIHRRARQRRIDVAHALRGAGFAQACGRVGLAGGGVHDHQPLVCAREQAVLAAEHGLDLRRAGHADEHDVARRGQLGGAGAFRRPGREQVGHAFAVAVDGDRQRMPLGEQVPGHAVAHQARGADESDALHARAPKVDEARIIERRIGAATLRRSR
jgi:hypothetical protein